MTHRIAILCGSLRKDSINRRVARTLCADAGSALDCTIVEFGDLPLYDSDREADCPAEWTRFRKDIAGVDGVLFVTPEYNRSVPGGLKNAIDVGSRPYGKSVWAKKPAGVITVSPGAIGGALANHHLRQSCVFLDMPMMQQPEAYLGNVSDDSFGEDGLLKDGDLRKFVGKIAGAFGDWVSLIRGGPGKIA